VLESVLDQEPTLGGIYTLEVSSPGVSRPLKFPRQYLKHIGRTLRVELVNGDKVEGELKTTNHDTITLEVAPKEKKGKPELREIAFAEIDEAYVTVSFNKK
jgi:ribosome maturation factor RimP